MKRSVLLGVIAVSLLAARGGTAGQQRQAEPSGVTKEQFEQWMTKLSNWGRWGKDDERGALNLITADKRKQAFALAKTGTVVSLSRPMVGKSAQDPAGRPIVQNGRFTNLFYAEPSPQKDGDYLFERHEIEYHGGTLSHLDALCHVAYKGRNYNGFVFKEIVTMNGGCSKLAITGAKEGIVTRGLLLDMPETSVRREDIEAWEKRTGLKVSAGDALLLRSRSQGAASPPKRGGYHPSLMPFLKERDIAVLGGDVAQEGGQIPGVSLPMHFFTLVALGVHLLDNLALDEVADTANRLKRWEFMLVVDPLRVSNGAGGAVNPLALF